MDKLVLVAKDVSVEKFIGESEGSRVVTIKGYANRYLDDKGMLVVDRSGDSVLPSGYNLDNFLKNPILLSYHSKSEPVGKIVDLSIGIHGLEITAEVHEALNHKVFYAVEQGILKTFSIGFKALDASYDPEYDIYYYRAVELLEVSIVSVPDNQDSLFTVLTQSPCATGNCLLASKATDEHTYKCASTIKNKSVSDHKWAEVNKQELSESAVSLAMPEVIKETYLVVGDVEKQATWKFPHHELKDGKLVLNKEGLMSALSALKSAIDVDKFSKEEKLSAAIHLQKHFNDLLESGDIEVIPADVDSLLKEFSEESESTESEGDDNNIEGKSVNKEDGDSSGTQDAEGDSQTAEGDDKEPAQITFEQVMSFVESLEGSDENINQLLSIYDTSGARANSLINSHLTQN